MLFELLELGKQNLLHLFLVEASLNNLWVEEDDGNDVALEGSTVNPQLQDAVGARVDVLQLLWSDVLTLTEFEDALCSVDDLD